MKTLAKSLLVAVPAAAATGCTSDEPSQPNIIYLMFDDLGYGDLGCYGQRMIETPCIDALAENGIRFTDMYTCAPLSAPSRACIMTGQHSGHSQIRYNDELRNYLGKTLIDTFNDHSSQGQFPLAEDTRTIAHVMKDAGYATGMFGKWGLGWPGSGSEPLDMGFDRFYGFNCQGLAHIYYPTHLWDDRVEVATGNDFILPIDRLAESEDPYDIHSYDRFTGKYYSSDLIFDQLTDFVDNHAEEPFFVMWTTTVPHSPVQAPLDEVMYYVDKFGDEEPRMDAGKYIPNRYPHASYAAMITHIDTQVGKLVDQLKRLGIYDNTIIVVTSDNGPASNGNSPMEYFQSGGPFRCREGWGKYSLHEGGVRMPFIVSWSKHTKGTVTSRLSSFADLMPTFADLAGGKESLNLPKHDGISFAGMLSGHKSEGHDHLYWEFPGTGGWVGVRTGNWKGMVRHVKDGNTQFELYDLSTDPQELNDVASEHPDITKKMWKIVKDSHEDPINHNPVYMLDINFPDFLLD